MARYRTIDRASSLPARDLLAREEILLQQARLGQSVRMRYLLVAIASLVGVVGFSTGVFATSWEIFFAFSAVALAANVMLDVARRRGWQRDWHFWAMVVVDTLLLGGNSLAVGRLAYLSLVFYVVAALGYSVGLTRAARVQLGLACVVYPLSRAGGLLLEGSPLTMASAGLIAIETFLLGAMGWIAITGPIRFTRRLHRARQALDDLSRGLFDTRLRTGALDDFGFLAVSFNRTAEALAESEALLVRQETELRQVDKLEAVGRLAGGVAHDFNNQLTVVLANLEMALAEIGPSGAGYADVEEAVHATRSAARVTRQLLAFGRKQILKPETIDVGATVEELRPMIARLVGPQIQVVTEIASPPCFTRADASQLAQVLFNLATNARDAMRDGGTLTLAVRPERVAGSVNRVLLSVRDTGVGMAPSTLARVFEPFFTTKGIGLGGGLGLATVHGVVAQSGGTVTVESTPGEGTIFRIFLPAVSAAPAEAPHATIDEAALSAMISPRRQQPAERAGGVVLLAEDEPAVRIATRRILERAGYQVIEASDGAEALKRFASREAGAGEPGLAPVEILVTDLRMPNVGGAELAARLRASRPDLPVVLMSGYSEEAVGGEGVDLPGAVFIGKPPQRHELVEAVRTLLAARAEGVR